MAMKCKWERFPYTQAFEQKHLRFFVHYLISLFQPQCVFLLFFSSFLRHKFPTFFFSPIPGRVAKREAELRPLVIEQHYACGG